MTGVAAEVAPIVAFDGGVSVCALPGESLLLAGLRAGLPLSYECASGGCGTCRAHVVAGAVSSRWPDATGLSERDRRRGDRVLMCQSVPEGPCTVRPAGWSAPGPEPTPARTTAVIASREMLTADTAAFLLSTDAPVDYLPGQFVIVEFADQTRRAYSMARPPDRNRRCEIELLVRAKAGGAGSGWLFDRWVDGMPVVVEGPYGRAYVRAGDDRPVLCLAGGTGLAPILAIAEHLIDASPGRAVAVYVGARTAADLAHGDRLVRLQEQGVRLVVAVEEEPTAPHETLGEVRTGYALDHLAAEWPDLSAVEVYLAGPTPMVDASLRRLVREGTLVADSVYFDRFVS